MVQCWSKHLNHKKWKRKKPLDIHVYRRDTFSTYLLKITQSKDYNYILERLCKSIWKNMHCFLQVKCKNWRETYFNIFPTLARCLLILIIFICSSKFSCVQEILQDPRHLEDARNTYCNYGFQGSYRSENLVYVVSI